MAYAAIGLNLGFLVEIVMSRVIIAASSGPELPAFIRQAGDKAAWCFLEFYTVNIRNKNKRWAYYKAGNSSNGARAGALPTWPM